MIREVTKNYQKVQPISKINHIKNNKQSEKREKRKNRKVNSKLVIKNYVPTISKYDSLLNSIEENNETVINSILANTILRKGDMLLSLKNNRFKDLLLSLNKDLSNDFNKDLNNNLSNDFNKVPSNDLKNNLSTNNLNSFNSFNDILDKNINNINEYRNLDKNIKKSLTCKENNNYQSYKLLENRKKIKRLVNKSKFQDYYNQLISHDVRAPLLMSPLYNSPNSYSSYINHNPDNEMFQHVVNNKPLKQVHMMKDYYEKYLEPDNFTINDKI